MSRPTRNTTSVVTRFTFLSYLRSRSFLIATLLGLVVIILGLSFPSIQSLIRGNQPEQKGTIELAGLPLRGADLQAIKEALPAYKIVESGALSSDGLLERIREPKIAGIFTLDAEQQFVYACRRRTLGEYPEQVIADILTDSAHYHTLREIGFSDQEAAGFLAEPQVRVVEEAELAGKSQAQTQTYTYILVLVLYMALISYGQMTASSVASEKSSRTMELLITATDPRCLIYGKVLGTGLAGFLQMLIFGLAYLFAYAVNRGTYGSNEIFTQALRMPFPILAMALLVFILAYLAFAFLFAALGSLVSRSEEINQVLSPMIFLLMAVFFAGVFATFWPDKLWVSILSYFPLVGPILFFVRFSMVEIPLWGFLLALLIHTLTVMGCARFAVRIYRSGVLRYGQAARFLDLFTFLRPRRS